TAFDAGGNLGTTYTGTVTFTSTDPAAGLPANYTFTAGDMGSHTFTIVWNTPGAQTVRATDVAKPTLTGALPVNVNPPLSGTTPPPAGVIGSPYSAPVVVGGTTPVSITILNGSLPPGLTVGPNGVLTGVPTLSGTFQVTLLVTDSLGATFTETISVVIHLRP